MPFRPETKWHLPQQPDLCRWRCRVCQQQSLSKDPAAAGEWHWRLHHDPARLEPALCVPTGGTTCDVCGKVCDPRGFGTHMKAHARRGEVA